MWGGAAARSPAQEKRRLDQLEFESVADAIAAPLLVIGQRVDVLGYSEAGDGGGASYKVVAGGTGTHGQGYWDCTIGVQLKFIDQGRDVNALAFGVKCDLGVGNTDNATALQNVAAYVMNRSQSQGGKIVLPALGPGYLSSAVTITGAKGLSFTTKGTILKCITTGTNNYVLNLVNCEDCSVHASRFKGTSDASTVYDDANRKGLIRVSGGKNIRIHHNVFEKCVSQCIYAENMTPATTIEGVEVDHNKFVECPFDTAGTPTSKQCGVYLADGVEYSDVHHNKFRGVQQAARFLSGANSNFTHNHIMACTATYAADRACFYHEASDNWGKLHINNNHINHNDSGLTPIICIGDAAVTANPVFITDNDILSNGNNTNETQIKVIDFPGSVIKGNNIRPNNATVNECIYLQRCDLAIVRDNFLRKGLYAVTADDCAINLGHNNYEAQGSKAFQSLNGGKFYYLDNRSISVHVLSGHTIETTDDAGITLSGSTVGLYEFAHSIGTQGFDVQCTAQETGSNVVFKVLKRAAVIDVYVVDDTGAAVNREFNMLITLHSDNEYILTNPRP